MTRYDIQVNKTSRNTVLFLMNIGATQATVDYLIQVLNEVAALCREEDIAKKGVRVDREPIALPGKRIFHRAFLSIPDVNYPASNLREAYFWALTMEMSNTSPCRQNLLNRCSRGGFACQQVS